MSSLTVRRNDLIYRARRHGFHIDTRQSTIFLHNNESFAGDKAVMRLINVHGFSVQYLDKALSDLPDQKFYISLPINSINPFTGSPYDISIQRAAALRVQKYLVQQGCRVFNPFRNGLPADAAGCDHMRADYRSLAECTSIIFLPGWQYSNGCKHEFLMASDMRLKMFTVDTETQDLKIRSL